EAVSLGLLCCRRACAQRHSQLIRAGVLQVQRVGAALRAVADDGNLLALDEIEIGVAIVIDTHCRLPSLLEPSQLYSPAFYLPRRERRTVASPVWRRVSYPLRTYRACRREEGGSAHPCRPGRRRCGTPLPRSRIPEFRQLSLLRAEA